MDAMLQRYVINLRDLNIFLTTVRTILQFAISYMPQWSHNSVLSIDGGDAQTHTFAGIYLQEKIEILY